jgi:glycerol uptake facilitator protein
LFVRDHSAPIPGEVVKGGYANVVLGRGLAVTFGIYIAGTISGAHLNPAVTLALAATKTISLIIAGFKNNEPTDGSGAWLPPVIGPIVGGLLGGFAYDLFVGKALIKAHAITESERASGRGPSHHES